MRGSCGIVRWGSIINVKIFTRFKNYKIRFLVKTRVALLLYYFNSAYFYTSTMDLRKLVTTRLKNQQLLHPTLDDPADVVKWFGAMQAQDYLASLWGIGCRTHHSIEKDVEQAIIDRKIVRSWPLRGTLHFVSANDIHWMLELSKARIDSKHGNRIKKDYNLNEKVFTRCKKILEKALTNNQFLTRDELYEVLEKSKISTGLQRGLHIISELARDGFICFGARKGKQQTFVLLDSWIRSPKKIKRDEGIVKLAERYFTSHGPATLSDFTWWSGLSPAEAKSGLEQIKSNLHHEDLDGNRFWMSSSALSSQKTNASTIHLLPSFDEYVISYANRSAVLEDMYFRKMVFTSNGIFNPVVVINGHVVGLWKRSFKNKGVEIDLKPFTSFSETQRKGILLSAKRYGEFVGYNVELK